MAPTALSTLDASFLYFDRPAQRLHVGCVALLDGPLPFDGLVEAIEQRLVATFPRYRQRPLRPPFDLGLPVWVDDPYFDVRRHVHHVAVPHPGDAAAFHELVDELFANRLDPAHPLWETILIDGVPGGGSAILSKMHHSMIDGVSGAQILERLADPIDADLAADAAPLLPACGAPVEPPRGPLGQAWSLLTNPEALRAQVRDVAELTQLAVSFVREPVPRLPFNGALCERRRVVWWSTGLDDVLAIRSAAGVKVNDVVLALVTGALHHYLSGRGALPDRPLRTVMPVSMRRPEQRTALGNLVAAMFPRLPVEVADARERLRRIAAETRTLKEHGQARAVGMFMQLASVLPTPLAALAGRVANGLFINTVCTNVPGPRAARTVLGRRILDLHPIVPLFNEMGLEFAIMSYADRLSIAAVADAALVSDAAAIPGCLARAAAELAEAYAPVAATAPVPSPPPARGAATSVADLMSAPARTVTPEDTLATAYRVMREARIRHLPVAGPAGELVGLVTHRDLLAVSFSWLQVPREEDRVARLADFRVGDVMETHLAVATPATPAAAAGEQLERHKIGCLPVVDRGRVVGILTEADFVRWATERLAAVAPGAAPVATSAAAPVATAVAAAG